MSDLCILCNESLFEDDGDGGRVRHRTRHVELGGDSGDAHEECAGAARVACQTPAWWLRANGVDLAPLTGTDHRAMRALAEIWEVYSYTRSPNALDAARSCLLTMQPKCRVLTKKLIARAMDWSDVDQLWPLVCDDDSNVVGLG